MEKALKIYTIIDGKEIPFPTKESQIEIYDFKYDAKRMGYAPSITANIMHPTCLDDKWGESVFVEFNQEKYFLKQTPTSSKTNTDARYKHEAEFVSERIALDNVFFFDAVVGNPESYDKPVSNSSTFTFFGTITELVSRLNASLEYCGLGGENGYKVVVDDGVDDGEEKLVSFENKTISEAIQEGYNQFEIPHYFVGKEIHYGFFQDAVNDEDTSFRYGLKNELLSITKTNSNQKIITRITGTGSTENIPYYYPNEHPQGVIVPHLYNDGEKEIANSVSVGDEKLFAKNVLYTDILKYTYSEEKAPSGWYIQYYQKKSFVEYIDTVGESEQIRKDSRDWFLAPSANWNSTMSKEWLEKYKPDALGVYTSYDYAVGNTINLDDRNDSIAFRVSFSEDFFISTKTTQEEINQKTVKIKFSRINAMLFGTEDVFIVRRGSRMSADKTNYKLTTNDNGVTWEGEFVINKDWFSDAYTDYDKAIYIVFEWKNKQVKSSTVKMLADVTLTHPLKTYGWQKNEKGSLWNIERYGLSFGDYKLPSDEVLLGYTIKFEQVAYVQPMQTLMPPVYWQSGGAERFYNAKNNTYEIPNSENEHYTFANEYRANKRIEHICQFDDIKPTIENVLNAKNESINEILDIAFDKDDNDLIDQEKNEYYHPYFYVKLKRFDGDYGFNLFTHASEKGEVTFAMKSGKCGACNFVLGVDSESGKNTVQVDNKGNLVYGNDGKVKLGIAQDRQNDTTKNEVWVALRKDTQTFGHVMPSVQHKYYPEVGDKFVLLNISLPKAYIEAAEKKLEQEIIKYMHENNEEKFSISIKFSRIYFAENPDMLHRLNENSLIHVTYNNVTYSLYVSSYSYTMNSDTALPEVTVELAETLSLSSNAIQSAVSQVKAEVLDRVSKMDIAALVASKYISKDNEDYAKQKITFNRGFEVGTDENITARINEVGNADLESATLKKYLSTPQFTDGFNGSGFKLWLDENNLSHLTIDILTARQRMNIYEMIISRIRSVNGEIWVSAANGKIKDVVEFDNYYEVVVDGTNLFQKGDFARCQVFSAGSQRFYWVELGEIDGNRIKITKTEFVNSLPSVDDELVLCGSKNINRQNAILISATEDGQPRISLYNGIATKDLAGCLRTQLGDLNNIQDDILKPHGDGLYSDNVFLKGNFVLSSRNESVETIFSITEDGIKSSMESLQTEAIKGKTLLYNASFIDGLKGWMTSNTDSTYFSGTSLLFASGSMLAQSVTVSNEPVYDNVFFVNIKNGWIKQSNLYFVNKPGFEADKQYPLFFSVNVRCNVVGILVVKVGDKEIYNAEIPQSDKFITIDVDNLTWNGQGDFYLSFSGEADFYGLTIYTSKTEVRHKTFFMQSEKLIGFAAQQLNTDGSIRQGSEVVATEEGAKINVVYTDDENQKHERTLGNFEIVDGKATKVTLSGDNIQLNGSLTANDKFKVREDGSIEATNGSFSGYLINKPLKVTEENYREFFVDYGDDYASAWSWKGWLLCSCVILKYTSADKNGSAYSTALTLPSVDANTVGATQEQLDTIRSFIGQSITVYNDNDTNKTRIDYHDRTGSTEQLTLNARTFASFVCKVNVDTNGTELVYWEKQAAGKIRTTQ